MKVNVLKRIIVIIALLIFISGCDSMENIDSTKVETLYDIAFDVNEKLGYTVYIKESSVFVPYLVLTSNYNGQALLLRKELLDEPRPFNEDISGMAGYYKDSSIDKFLNGEFMSVLDPQIQNSIVDSEITITSESSLGVTGTDTENIVRKVFLLSYTEIDLFDDSGLANAEGKPLQYFKEPSKRIAYNNKEARSWMLRTSYTWYHNTSWGIGPKGTIGSGSVDGESGVRPAFCLKHTHTIEKSDNVVEGETVYVIAN